MLVILILFALSFTLCVIYIKCKWKIYVNDVIFRKIDLLRRYNILSGVWPCDDGFMSLIFSAFRHTIIPIVFSLIIWFSDSNILHSALLFISLLYAISIIPRYKVRKRDYISAGEASRELLKPVKSACFSIIVCAFLNYFILLGCYLSSYMR